MVYVQAFGRGINSRDDGAACSFSNSVSSPADLRLFKLSHAMSSSVCLKLVSFFRAALMSC